MGDHEFWNAREAVEYLEGRIAERRDNERRQKILDNIRLIRNRRNQEIVIPIPEGHDQEMWFEKLEANGIWDRVFEFMSPSDVTSAYFACNMFKRLLEKKRMEMHLPKVLAILPDTRYLRYPNWAIHREQIIKRREVLNLRLVSKMWKNAVDGQFVAPLDFSDPNWYLERSPDTSGQNVFRTKIWDHTQCVFERKEDVNMAMEALGASKLSPSLTRTLSLNAYLMKATDGSDRDSFYSKVIRFLDAHGDAVWVLEVRGVKDYEVLCNFMSRMPHLKALKLECIWSGLQFQQQIALVPFPSVASLEACYFWCDGCRSDLLITEILNKNSNLKAIHFKCKHALLQPFPDCVWNALSNVRLEHFNLDLCDNAWREYVFMEQLLERLGGLNCPLKVLRIIYTGTARLRLGAFLEISNRFNQSLEELFAMLSSNRIDGGGCVVADFPNLRKIMLY